MDVWDVCLLCLEPKQESPECILVTSNQWQEEKMGDIIQKHFWPLNHIASTSWICTKCWDMVREFHKFYLHIEDSHKSFTSLLKLEPEDCEIKTTKNADTLEANDVTMSNDKSIDCLDGSKCDDAKSLPCLALMKCETNNQEEEIVAEQLNKAPRTRRSKDPLQTSVNTIQTRKSRMSTRKTRKKTTTAEVQHLDVPTNNQKDNDSETERNPEDSVENLDVGFNSDADLNPSDNVMSQNEDVSNNTETETLFIFPPKTKQEEADDFLTENLSITCDICKSPMKTFQELCKHFQQEHKQPGYVRCCKKKFSSRSLLVDHVHCHLDPDYFKCNLCGKVTADRFCLKNHFQNHKVRERSEICDICGKAFTLASTLKKHKLLHLPDEEKKYPCEECGKLFADKFLLNNHFRFVHSKKYVHICDICGAKLSGKDALERHQLKHKGIPRPTITCNICGLKMTDPSYLKRHIATQHPEDGKKEFKCHLCPKVSPTLKSLKRHIVYKHETGYDFKCTICDKGFKRSTTLKEHMAAHMGTALYTCPHCPKTFNSNANMHHHRKKVHPKEWEETCRARYSGNLPPNYKGPGTMKDELEMQTISYQFDVLV